MLVTATVGPAPLRPSLEDACRRWGPRPAVTAGGLTITYEQLWGRVLSLARAYEQLGVQRGDRIVCQLRNGAEHLIAVGAAWARGAVHVGADNDLTGPELARLAQRLDAAALLYQPPSGATDPLAPLQAVREASPRTQLIVHGCAAGSEHGLEQLLSSPHVARPLAPAPLDPAVIFLTSGTTGEPKAVVEPLAAHWAKMQFFADAFAPGPDDVHLLSLPIAHVFGLRLALLALLRGGRLVLLERFSPDLVLDVIGREAVTVLPAVPTHLRLLMERYEPGRHDVSGLRWVLSAASGLPATLAEWVYATLDARIMFVYGCSEGFTTLTTVADEILAGSVGSTVFRGPPGTPADGTVRVEDTVRRTPVGAGETGEIVFGAARPVAYWDQPPVATDGWYRTGDLGRLDAQGRLYVVGRLKALVNRGGLHVSCAEVELALVRHPAVADAAVIAAPDPVLGEAVCACVVPAGPQPPDLSQLRDFLAGILARHKLPDELAVLDAIPRTVIGKVNRAALETRVIGGGAPRERARRA